VRRSFRSLLLMLAVTLGLAALASAESQDADSRRDPVAPAAAASSPTQAPTGSPTQAPAGSPTEAPAGDAPAPAIAEMLKSMLEKGLLSQDEYEDIYRRQASYEAKELVQSSLPSWIRGWTFRGDLRLRLERQDWRSGIITPTKPLTPGSQNVDIVNNTAIDRRDRARMRFRVGAEKELLEGLEVGVRVATSQATTYGQETGALYANFSTPLVSDPRSTNVTLGDYFAPKAIFLDLAFLRWAPSFAPGLLLTGGKILNPFRSNNFPDLVVWDPDVTPEGTAAEYHLDLLPEYLWSDSRAGYFFVNEVGAVNVNQTVVPFVPDLPTLDEKDPYMYAAQQEFTALPLPWLRLGGRASYYDVRNINTKYAAAAMDLGNTGNAISQNPLYFLLPGSPFFSNGRSSGKMQELAVDAYFSWTQLGDRWQVTPFVQWSSLLNAHTQNQTFSLGATLGDAELLKVTVMWSKVDANGTISLFTDSDLFDGQTNAKGWYVAVERRLTRGVRVRAAYMDSKIAQPACSSGYAAAVNQPLAYCNSGAFTASPTGAAQYLQTSRDRYRVQLDMMVDF